MLVGLFLRSYVASRCIVYCCYHSVAGDMEFYCTASRQCSHPASAMIRAPANHSREVFLRGKFKFRETLCSKKTAHDLCSTRYRWPVTSPLSVGNSSKPKQYKQCSALGRSAGIRAKAAQVGKDVNRSLSQRRHKAKRPLSATTPPLTTSLHRNPLNGIPPRACMLQRCLHSGFCQ